MGRPQTIFIDLDALLAGIATEHARQLQDVDAVIGEIRQFDKDSQHAYRLEHIERADLFKIGVRWDLERFMGRGLTDSERLRVQQGIHRLESIGLVEIPRRRFVKLTANGLARLEAAGNA